MEPFWNFAPIHKPLFEWDVSFLSLVWLHVNNFIGWRFSWHLLWCLQSGLDLTYKAILPFTTVKPSHLSQSVRVGYRLESRVWKRNWIKGIYEQKEINFASLWFFSYWTYWLTWVIESCSWLIEQFLQRRNYEHLFLDSPN